MGIIQQLCITGMVLISIIILLLYKMSKMAFKIGYYEQTLKNHKDKFTEERYKNIENVMNK